jgi:hypothetical protein
MTVKEDNSLKLTRSQDSVWLTGVILAGYDWEYLIKERHCELAVSFEIFFYIEFFLFFVLFSFIRIWFQYGDFWL